MYTILQAFVILIMFVLSNEIKSWSWMRPVKNYSLSNEKKKCVKSDNFKIRKFFL